jgi:hypothetical protein
VIGWSSFEPWLSQLETLEPDAIWKAIENTPPLGCRSDWKALEQLGEILIARRGLVRTLIEQFRVTREIHSQNGARDYETTISAHHNFIVQMSLTMMSDTQYGSPTWTLAELHRTLAALLDEGLLRCEVDLCGFTRYKPTLWARKAVTCRSCQQGQDGASPSTKQEHTCGARSSGAR